MRTILTFVAVLVAVLPLAAGTPCNNAAAILPGATVYHRQETITYSQPVTVQTYALPAQTVGGCCGSAPQSLPMTYQQSEYPAADVTALLAQCQSLLQTYQQPAASLAVPAYASGAYVNRQILALPTYGLRSYTRDFIPARQVTYLPAPRQVFRDVYPVLPGRVAAPVYAPPILGHGIPGDVRAFNPGGFRAGFSGGGLNAGGGGAGFLTGGGILGGAANLLGVSSAGLERAALGILATRSNLFGLAPRRR